MSGNKIYYSTILTYQVKNGPENKQLYRKNTQNSLKIHFITVNSFIYVFTD